MPAEGRRVSFMLLSSHSSPDHHSLSPTISFISLTLQGPMASLVSLGHWQTWSCSREGKSSSSLLMLLSAGSPISDMNFSFRRGVMSQPPLPAASLPVLPPTSAGEMLHPRQILETMALDDAQGAEALKKDGPRRRGKKASVDVAVASLSWNHKPCFSEAIQL
ncbi:hypothetical protein Taro_051766 [Colocasia esculenta]|uniref:Uncharacterized protein n=1 Tax=Colocasia esculenta TaxID=4460 RepID=A0A843XGX6_COLES|nr:hypothetical protein [Colocasia esculenta]